MCYFHFLIVLYRWEAQIISLKQAIMYVYNNQKGIKSQKQNQCKFKINPFYMVIRSHVQLMASLELETRYFLFQCPHSSYDVSIRNSETFQFNSVQLLSCVQLFATPCTTACQTSLPIINSGSLLKRMSFESVMPSNHLILCCPLLLPASIFPSNRVFK